MTDTNKALEWFERNQAKATDYYAMEAFSFILKHKAALSAPQKDNINIEVDGKKIDTMEEFIAYAEGRKAGWNDHIRALSPNAVAIPREHWDKVHAALEAYQQGASVKHPQIRKQGAEALVILSQYGEQK